MNKLRGTIGVLAVAASVSGSAYAILVRPRISRWGATEGETRKVLPGDQLVSRYGHRPVSTRAITIDAPPEVVWPWLVQMGSGRAGFYTHEWVERLLFITYADGHSWVVPRKPRSAREMAGIVRVLQFLWDNDFEWSRTGHLPASEAVIRSERWRALPHRATVAKLVDTAAPLPPGVQRQFLIQQILSEEMESAITGQKPIDAALADAQRRVNDLLFNLL